MPRLEPKHEDYLPEEPSPLGLCWYTTEDVKQEVKAAATAALDNLKDLDGLGTGSRVTSPELGTRRDSGTDEDEEVQKSPRKGRKVAVAGEEERDGESWGEFTLTAMGCAQRQAYPTMAPMAADVSWSFRALEEDASAGEPTSERQIENGGSAEPARRYDERAPTPPTPRLRPVDPEPSPTDQPEIGEAAHVLVIYPALTSTSLTGTTDHIDHESQRARHIIDIEMHHSEPQAAESTQPDNPDELPAQPAFATEGTGRLAGLVSVGNPWS